MKESYIRHTFFSKPFVTAQIQSRQNRTGSKFYFSSGKFCPDLQVLQMEHSNFSHENLVLLGCKLQFFTCRDFSPGRSARIAPFLLTQFPNLKGFISFCESDDRYINSLNKELLQLNRPVVENGL